MSKAYTKQLNLIINWEKCKWKEIIEIFIANNILLGVRMFILLGVMLIRVFDPIRMVIRVFGGKNRLKFTLKFAYLHS